MLRRFADSHQPEGQSLEFIRDLPADTDQGKVDFLREVVGMVNSGGGIVIYGISDDAGKAGELVGVPLAGAETRLRQLIIDRIQPSIRFDIIPVIDTGDRGCVVVEVLESGRIPHCLTISNRRYEYPVRAGTDRRYLSPSEVTERFRGQFNRTDELSKSVARRVDAVLRGRPPRGHVRAYVAAIPIEPQPRLFPVMNTWTATQIPRPSPFLGTYPALHAQSRPTFQAFQLLPDFGEVADQIGFLEFGADGSFVRSLPSQMPRGTDESGHSRPAKFLDTEFAGYLIGAIEGLHALHHHFDVTGPLLMVYGITENLLPAVLEPVQLQGRYAPFEAAPLNHPVEGQVEVLLADTRPIDRMREISKVILDDVFSAFGWPGCQLIDGDGYLQWPGHLQPRAEEWNTEQRLA